MEEVGLMCLGRFPRGSVRPEYILSRSREIGAVLQQNHYNFRDLNATVLGEIGQKIDGKFFIVLKGLLVPGRERTGSNYVNHMQIITLTVDRGIMTPDKVKWS